MGLGRLFCSIGVSDIIQRLANTTRRLPCHCGACRHQEVVLRQRSTRLTRPFVEQRPHMAPEH
jgi:hypothetical protein